MNWFRRKTTTSAAVQEERSVQVSVSDPVLAEWFGVGNPNYTGVTVGEGSTLSIAAVWRAVSLIAQTIAALPARSIQDDEDGTVTRVRSWVDAPGGPGGPTAFEFWETVLFHLLLHGNAYLLHIRAGGGGLVGLFPIHPTLVATEFDNVSRVKTYTLTLDDGRTRVYTDADLLHIPALSSDGVRGLSPISIARNSFGTSIAGERASARIFGNGALHVGMVTPDEDVEEDEALEIKRGLDSGVAGWDRAGEIAVINRKLKFTPWTMTNEDAQFLQSRQFQIEEVARWFGVPPFMLMQTEKQTSWGTGIESQQRGLARQVLGPWTRRIEQRIGRLLPPSRRLEFDFSGLERPTPEVELDSLIKQVEAGLMTVNEARAVRNMPPVEGGDVIGAPRGADTNEEPEDDDD